MRVTECPAHTNTSGRDQSCGPLNVSRVGRRRSRRRSSSRPRRSLDLGASQSEAASLNRGQRSRTFGREAPAFDTRRTRTSSIFAAAAGASRPAGGAAGQEGCCWSARPRRQSTRVSRTPPWRGRRPRSGKAHRLLAGDHLGTPPAVLTARVVLAAPPSRRS